MTEDGGARFSSDDSAVSNDASQTKQRKKRKWDQPAEAFISAGVSVSYSNMGNLASMPLPGVSSVPCSFLSNPLAPSGIAVTPVFQQHATPVVSKQNQSKIQDELVIAREIVINDAESSIRYKLTKRQTQEEIQRCTGAVVITRGKYRPPDSPAAGEKPLYLHISAAAHLKETSERILAVDRAAAMVEEMLKHGQSSQAASSPIMSAMSNGVKALSTCVYLGFDADPSLNVAARIRGPNDQYINHIVNETGATVILRGYGSGSFESPQAEEAQQPLHLFLSSNNPKSLDDAKRLAENLLDTISVEFGATRSSSSKVYGAVPPPQQLLTGVQSSPSEQNVHAIGSPAALTAQLVTAPAPPVTVPGITVGYSQGLVGGMLNSGPTQGNTKVYPQPLVTRGTSYIGYGGIYPQATPLQQVALALRQSSTISSAAVPATSVASTVAPTTSPASMVSTSSISSTLHTEKLQRPPQKRKFQELPAGSNDRAKSNQESESLNPSKPLGDLGVQNLSSMPAPKKLVPPSSKGKPEPPPRTIPLPPPKTMMPPPPPPPKAMPPLPPPPKFTSSTPSGKLHDKNEVTAKFDAVPETLVQLMAYGDDEDDDSEESSDDSLNRTSNTDAVRKPFWAL